MPDGTTWKLGGGKAEEWVTSLLEYIARLQTEPSKVRLLKELGRGVTTLPTGVPKWTARTPEPTTMAWPSATATWPATPEETTVEAKKRREPIIKFLTAMGFSIPSQISDEMLMTWFGSVQKNMPTYLATQQSLGIEIPEEFKGKSKDANINALRDLGLPVPEDMDTDDIKMLLGSAQADMADFVKLKVGNILSARKEEATLREKETLGAQRYANEKFAASQANVPTGKALARLQAFQPTTEGNEGITPWFGQEEAQKATVEANLKLEQRNAMIGQRINAFEQARGQILANTSPRDWVIREKARLATNPYIENPSIGFISGAGVGSDIGRGQSPSQAYNYGTSTMGSSFVPPESYGGMTMPTELGKFTQKGQTAFGTKVETPSAQGWASAPWSVQQQLLGYYEALGGQASDLAAAMQRTQPNEPSRGTAWKPRLQYA